MNLKEIRVSRKLKVQEVSDYLCCLPSVYSRYENGKREPSIDILLKLSKLYSVSVDYLIGNTDNPQSHKNAGDAMYDFIRSLELLSRATSEVQEHLDHLLNYSIDEKD